jgi:hypothetical protein
MRLLTGITAFMAVLIVLGTALLGVLIVRRLNAAAPAHGAMRLDEPAGTRLLGIAATQNGLALALTGGGPDRVVVLDPATLRERARLTVDR